MQVALNKVDLNQESNWCSSCMISKEGLKDLNINLRCGMLIFNEKYNTFCKSDGTAKTVGGGVSVFINSLNDCYDEYKKYDGNCLSMAIRAYNGLGCGKNADLDYVESVLSYAEGYK